MASRRGFLSLLLGGAASAAVTKPAVAAPARSFLAPGHVSADPAILVSHSIRFDLAGAPINVFASNGCRTVSMLIDSFRDMPAAKDTVLKLLRDCEKAGWLTRR